MTVPIEDLLVPHVIKNLGKISWNSTVRYRVNTSPPFLPVLCQANSIHVFSFCFLKIHFNIITTTRPRSSKQSLEFRVLYKFPQTYTKI